MRHLALIAALFTASACDETPTTPTSQDLAGRWLVSSMLPAATATVTPPIGALAVEFADDRLSVQSDCNICSGRYTLTGRTITVSPLACTLRACPPGSFDDPFFDLVSSAETARILSGQVLMLEGRKGRVTFHR